MEKICLEHFLAQRGLSMPVSDFMLDKVRFPHGLTLRKRQQLEKDAARVEAAYQEKRAAAIREYNQLVEKGEIIKPSRIDMLIMTAQGHDDNEHVQAARRLLTKRGIDWKTAKENANKETKNA